MQRTRVILATALLGLLAFGTSCGKSAATPKLNLKPQPTDSEAVKYAKMKWQTLCITCHGAEGKGDGIAGQALNPKPRNYGDKAWQKSVADEEIRKAIVEGGAAVGKSASMPANPDLVDKPEAVDFLVKVVRSFGE